MLKGRKKQIAEWIEIYARSESAIKVMHRSWNSSLVHKLQCDRRDANGIKVSTRWSRFIQDNLSSFGLCPDFKTLHNIVKKYAENFFGIGVLTIYDTATCIGFPQGLYPKVIYLHAGTREGAHALGIKGSTATKEQFIEICSAFDMLEPAQIEDFLCIYKKQLQGKTTESPQGCCGC